LKKNKHNEGGIQEKGTKNQADAPCRAHHKKKRPANSHRTLFLKLISNAGKNQITRIEDH